MHTNRNENENVTNGTPATTASSVRQGAWGMKPGSDGHEERYVMTVAIVSETRLATL